MATIEVSDRLRARSNEVTIRWVPAHQGTPGNEKADEYAKTAADPEGAVPDDYRWETSLTHMTRVATEARTRSTAQWIADHAGTPDGSTALQRGGVSGADSSDKLTPKTVAGRYYQLLSGHAAIGPCLKDKIHKTVDDKCWWCGGGRRQTRHHLFTECRAWRPQIAKLWKDIGKACGWRDPRAPGQVALEGEGHRSGFEVLEGYQGRVH